MPDLIFTVRICAIEYFKFYRQYIQADFVLIAEQRPPAYGAS
jgi:hypothetical protein